jgi:hypothetical protein
MPITINIETINHKCKQSARCCVYERMLRLQEIKGLVTFALSSAAINKSFVMSCDSLRDATRGLNGPGSCHSPMKGHTYITSNLVSEMV